MASAEQATRIYRELAEDYGRQGQAQMRDRFLVLAADAALAAGQQDEAERLRGRLLQHNPHHLLKPYSSFAEAMNSMDVQNYVSALRRNHPYEKAEHLLEGLRQGKARPPTSSPSESEPRVLRVVDMGGESGLHAKPSSPGSAPPGGRPVLAAHSSQPPLTRSASVPKIVPLRREPYPVD